MVTRDQGEGRGWREIGVAIKGQMRDPHGDGKLCVLHQCISPYPGCDAVL